MNFLCCVPVQFYGFSTVTEVLGLPWGDQRPSPAAPDDVSTTAPRWTVTAGCGLRGDLCDTKT